MIFNKINEYLKKEKNLFKNNSDEILKVNRTYIIYIQVISIISLLLLTILSFFTVALSEVKISYIFELAVVVVSLIIYLSFNKIPPTIMFYLLFSFLIGNATYVSNFIYPDFLCVVILCFLAFMPLLTLDSSLRIIMVETIFLSIYIVFILIKKESFLVHDEIIDAFLFTVVGLLIGQFTRKTRLDNLELRRQSLIRETTDVLTGLNNRRKLFDYFILYESGKMADSISAMGILDIDFFKNYNDIYGHLAGDKCLCQVGKCLAKYGKEHDIDFYRYGGEEFVAISHSNDKEKIHDDFKNICSIIYELKIKHECSSNGFVSVSGGYVTLNLTPLDFNEKEIIENDSGKVDTIRFQQILAKADDALYNAKQLGRNQIVMYSSQNKKVLNHI